MEYFVGYLIVLIIFLRVWYVMNGGNKSRDRINETLVKHSCKLCLETDLSWYPDGDDWMLINMNGRKHECKEI